MNAEWVALEKVIQPYLNDLKHFKFSYVNPLFWALIFTLFCIFAIIWRPKKSLSFCLIVSAILLINTQIENFIGSISTRADGVDPAAIARVASGIVVVFIAIYYALIRED